MSADIITPDRFYSELSEEGEALKPILFPLAWLDPRERFVFTEYHYYKTHMRAVAESLKISLSRSYELLYRAEEKIAAAKKADSDRL